MNARIPSDTARHTTLTTVFISGNSQAVRLPKEFRFSTKQVTIERRGDEVVLREKKRSLGELLREALKDVAPISDGEARSLEEVLATTKDQGSLQDRAMWTDPTFWDSRTTEQPAHAVPVRQAATAPKKARSSKR